MEINKCLFAIFALFLSIAFLNKNKITESWSGIQNITYAKHPVHVNKLTGDVTSSKHLIPPSTGNSSICNKNTFVQYPSFQSNLAPRQSSVSISSAVHNNLPSVEHLAVPQDPLNNEQIMENYNCVSSITPKCTDNSPPPRNVSQNQNHHDDTHGLLPSVDATNHSGPDNTVTYDRLIYSRRKTRNTALGCKIRGDLTIQPQNIVSRTSASTSDLAQGAMNVIAGPSVSSADLSKFHNDATGRTAIGGVDVMSHHISHESEKLLHPHNQSLSTHIVGNESGPFQDVSHYLIN